jgi:BirA family transcriptional regulator, biotin operon repressor / biotin---[acetyl-CoA-carboxylase] ligase
MEAVRAAVWEGAPAREWREAWGVPGVELLRSVGSTNDRARELADAGAPHGTVVIAEEQTAGRGRERRPWLAAPGRAILLSVVLRPPAVAAAAPGAIPLRVGLAAAEALAAATGLAIRVKWPNDLVVGDRKLGGILCEGSVSARDIFVVAGIGVNVNQTREELDPALRETATSLRLLLGDRCARAELAAALVAAVSGAARLEPLHAGELDRLARRDALRGRLVSLNGVPAGTARGIAPDGALLVHGPAGVREVRYGTVRPVAPALQREDP